jgi:hypothetical protein
MRSTALALEDALALHLAELVGRHFRWTHLEKLESASALLETVTASEEHAPY